VSNAAKMPKNRYAKRAARAGAMHEQRLEPLPQTRWSLKQAVEVLHQNGWRPKFNTLSKLHGGIEFQVYSARHSSGQAIVFKYPSERWVYNDNDWGIDRFELLRQERNLLSSWVNMVYLSRR
jgi:hypothetical protein